MLKSARSAGQVWAEGEKLSYPAHVAMANDEDTIEAFAERRPNWEGP